MSKKRNVPAHGRKAARSRRPRKRRFLVVAGGAVTEKQYFKQLESLYDVIIDYQQKNNSPKQLAKLAVKLKREDKRDTSTDCYERIWVVVDVDDFHDHGEAARICNDNGIELIISNPCFEVWLLDYVTACPSSYTLTLMSSQLQQKLKLSAETVTNTSTPSSLTKNISMPPYAMQPGTIQRKTARGVTDSRLIMSRNTPLGPICQK